jgi:small GTP-binding protein
MLVSGQPFRDAKVVMLGCQSVGKTSLVNRLIHHTFGATASTVGAVFFSQTVTVGDVQIKLNIWDTGGSERYRSMAPMYFRDAHAAIIVYDITSVESFNDVAVWLNELYQQGPEAIVIALVGNKSDLHERRTVAKAAVAALAEKEQVAVNMETSAVTGENVAALFDAVAEKVLNAEHMAPSNRGALKPRGQANDTSCGC